MSAHISNVRPDFDQVIVDIVDYVHKQRIASREASPWSSTFSTPM